MPRAKLIRSDSQPYHITSRSNNKEWFYIPTQYVWQYANELLALGESRFNIQVDAFVLMNNHYHLCIHTPDANIDKFMHFFNKNLGKKISRHAKRINRIFGAPYKWSLISNNNYYFNVIKYIYQNPLRAGIVKSCLDYPYSDLRRQKFTQQELEWFDELIPDEEAKSTRTKLRRFNIKD